MKLDKQVKLGNLNVQTDLSGMKQGQWIIQSLKHHIQIGLCWAEDPHFLLVFSY